MIDNNELMLWPALVRLTQIDNETSLFHESKAVISELFTGVQIYFYKIHIKRDGRQDKHETIFDKSNLTLISNYFDNKMSMYPISNDPHLKACYIENKSITYNLADENQVVYIFPLGDGKDIQYLLRIVIPGPREKHPENLLNFFNVLINYYRIIRSNERDFLTGMYNRRAFNRVMNTLEIHPAVKQPDKDDFLIILDIDFFKAINDNFGHMIGDEVLIVFSRILRENIRAMDVAFRTGGEEFVIITYGLTLEDVTLACERLRLKIEQTNFPQVTRLTVSGGFSKLEYPLDTYFTLKKADCALYYAKDHGRNRMYCYETLVDENLISPVSHFKEIMDVW